ISPIYEPRFCRRDADDGEIAPDVQAWQSVEQPGGLQRLPVLPKEWMWAVELPKRHLMGDEAPKISARQPGTQRGSWRFDAEGRCAGLREIKVDGVVGSRTNGGGDAGDNGQCRTMDMARRNELNAGMTPYNRRKHIRIEQVLPVHMPNAGPEGR